MTLTVLDRLMVLASLPKEGGILFLRAREELNKKVGFSGEELELWGLKQDPEGKVTWDNTKPQTTEIELSVAEKAIIRDGLRRLDGEGRLTPGHLGVWELFVEEKGA